MRRRLTADQYKRANESANARRFQDLVAGDSGVALRKRVPSLVYWFTRNDVAAQDTGDDTPLYWRDTDQGVITLMVDGTPSVLFYLVGRRIDSCTFAYHLYPRQLTKAVTALRRAKLGRFIRPAAKWTLKKMPETARPILEAALHDLLRQRGQAR